MIRILYTLLFLGVLSGETVTLPLAEATWIEKAHPEMSHGADQLLQLNDESQVLLRFDTEKLRNHRGEIRKAELVIPMREAGTVSVAMVHEDAATWQAGKLAGKPEEGAACWNYLQYSAVKHVQSGEPFHVPWPKQKQGAVIGQGNGSGPVRVSLDIGQQPWSWADGLNPGFVVSGKGAFDRRGVTLELEVADLSMTPGYQIRYELDRDAQVSLIICDAEGAILSEVLHAAKRSKGPQIEVWNGRKSDDTILPSGKYTWKLLVGDGLSATYVGVLGISRPLWETWPGNHIPALGLAVDEEGFVYLAAGCSESPGMALKMAPDGSRQWTMHDFWFNYAAWQGGHSMAVDGKNLWLLQEDYHLQRVSAEKGWNKDDGPYSAEGGFLGRACFDIAIDEKKRPSHPEHGWNRMKQGTGRVTAAVDMDCHDGVVVVSYRQFDRLRWYDGRAKAPRDGKPVPGVMLHEVSIPQPEAVAACDDGSVLVISAGALFRCQRDGRTEVVIPASRLVSPFRLCIEKKTRNILIAERGESQQIVRFSETGAELNRYGTPGGRPAQGLYDPRGFREISDIAVGPDGGIWVTEAFTAPRRTVHLSADGKFMQEWYGGQMYANRAAVDPENPQYVWMDSQWGEVIQAKVDWATGAWTVHATYSYMYPLQDGYRHEAGLWMVRHHEGETYLCNEREINVMRVDEAGRRLIPVAKHGCAYYPGGNEGWRIPESLRDFSTWDLDEAKQRDPNDDRSHKPWNYQWHDTDGDGVVGQAEIRFGKELIGTPRCLYVTADLSYITCIKEGLKVNGSWAKFDKNGLAVCRVLDWNAAGVPRYDYHQREVLSLAPWSFATAVTMDESAGLVYLCQKQRIGCYDIDGKARWFVGIAGKRGSLRPGQIAEIYRPIGTVHDSIAVAEIHDGRCPVWHRDGLWMGSLLDQPTISDLIPPEAYKLCGENFGGSIFTHPETGVTYFLGGGDNATPIYRIDGWDSYERRDGTITLSQDTP